jgi:hypothetical protein
VLLLLLHCCRLCRLQLLMPLPLPLLGPIPGAGESRVVGQYHVARPLPAAASERAAQVEAFRGEAEDVLRVLAEDTSEEAAWAAEAARYVLAVRAAKPQLQSQVAIGESAAVPGSPFASA